MQLFSTISSRRCYHLAIALSIVILCGLLWPTAAQAQSRFGPFEYVSPRPDAILVMAKTTIAVRHGDELDAASLSADQFTVEGSMSGAHSGSVLLADDLKTVIFTPEIPFTPEEMVSVTLNPALQTSAGETIEGTFSYTFTVSPLTEVRASSLHKIRQTEALAAYDAQYAELGEGLDEITGTDLHTDTHPYATIPATFPFVSVTVPADGAGEGHIFAVNLTRRSDFPYLLILDNSGEPLFFRQMEEGIRFRGLRPQPNGKLTYFYTPDSIYHEMDETYQIVGSYQVGNGYLTDFHGLQVNEEGYSLIQVYDDQPVDMSQIVEGGLVTATVTGSIVQEVDPSGNVIFEWRSWDHFDILDASDQIDFTSDDVDVTHINSADWDSDGNIIMSNRNIDEITKVDRATGDLIWRFGGKKNQFTLTDTEGNEIDFFNWQHDARRQETGTLTLYDNGNHKDPPHSRAVEYELDEENLTAVQVWEYRNDPDFFGTATGNVQRLPNGNSLINWGGVGINDHLPFITEVTPDGTKAYEAYFQTNQGTYRTFRFPWEGRPFEPPMLVASSIGEENTLHYSWNGATNVASYDVYGGTTTNPADMVKVDSQTKESYETVSELEGASESCYFYSVTPVDGGGEMGTASNLIFAGDDSCELVATVTSDGVTDVMLDAPEVSGSVTVNADAGVVSDTVTLVLDDIASPTQPLMESGKLLMAFRLDAQVDGMPQHGMAFNAPLSLAVSYAEEAAENLDEATLDIRYWNAGMQMWQSDGIEVTASSADDNQVTFTTSQPALFAIFAQETAPQEAPTAIAEAIELLIDGSFELPTADSPWSYLRANNNTRSLACIGSGSGCGYSNVPVYDGERIVYFGFFSEAQQASATQSFKAPALADGDTATLSLWVMNEQLEGSKTFTGNNNLQILIDETEAISFTGLDLTEGRYIEFTADVTQYLSGDHTLRIQGDFEANGGAFYIDDISLEVNMAEGSNSEPTQDSIRWFLPLIMLAQ